MKKKILFRADGSSSIGLGHVYRSCAVAQITREHFTTSFAIKEPSKELMDDILGSADRVISLKAELSTAEEVKLLSAEVSRGDIIILDGYHFTGAYQQALKSITTAAVVCIDDIHTGMYEADAVINHIGGISISDYQSTASTAFFLGIAYSLINRVFLETRPNWGNQKNLLVCLGGADPYNHTLTVLSAVPVHRFDKIVIIIGSGYRHRASLAELIKDKPITIYQNLPPVQVAQIMSTCRYAVLSPSTVSYEYMHIGGIAYLYQIAANQQRVKEFYLANTLALDFSCIETEADNEADNEEELLRNQKFFFDRQSHYRLRKLLEGLSFIKSCDVRKANEMDKAITFQWANDPVARAMSFNDQPIPFETHSAWFDKKVTDPGSYYYLFEIAGRAVAQIRFDVVEHDAVLSYFISPEKRGNHLGVWILAEGIRCLLKENSLIQSVAGFVKETNIASCKSFDKLRFEKKRATEYPASFKYTMQLKNEF